MLLIYEHHQVGACGRVWPLTFMTHKCVSIVPLTIWDYKHHQGEFAEEYEPVFIASEIYYAVPYGASMDTP